MYVYEFTYSIKESPSYVIADTIEEATSKVFKYLDQLATGERATFIKVEYKGYVVNH